MRAYWEACLSDQNYEVITKGTVEAAVSACQRIPPDLILLSDSIPDFHEDNFLRRLKHDPYNRLTPIVFLDSSVGSINFAEALEAQAQEIWTQPLPQGDAILRVQFLLKQRAVLDEQAQSTILSLAQTVDAREPGQRGHSGRVSNYALRLGTGLQLREDELEALRVAGIVHDIGKAALPDEVLQKNAQFDNPFNSQESWVLQQHPVLGEEICAPCKAFRPVLSLIRRHHERIDGSGYPDGIRGCEISLSEQIMQLVEFYDSLITEHSLHNSITLPDALSLLYEEADRGRFAQELVYRFGCLLVGEESSKALRANVKRRPFIIAR